MQAAAQTFYGKAARDLNLPEAALIAGMTQSPSRTNPLQNPSAALLRRNEVIQAMAAAKADLVCLTVPNRGHAPLLDEPACRDALDDFIARH